MGRVEEESVGCQEMRYRRKSAEVYAVRFSATPEGIEELKSLCGLSLGRVIRPAAGSPAEAEICSLEGGRMVVTQVATEGDWVVMEPPGRLHVCGNDVFESKYEPIA